MKKTKKPSKKSKLENKKKGIIPIILGASARKKELSEDQSKSSRGTSAASKEPEKKVEKAKKTVMRKDDTRCPTGIPGFDDLVQGGFPRGSSILVCGGPGTGKSIFCEQFIVNGARELQEKSLYVSFEQRAEEIRLQAKQFGFDIEALEKKGLLEIISIPVSKITPKTIKEIKNIVKKNKVKRLVIDSLSTLIINAPIYISSGDMSVEDVMGDNVTLAPPVIGDYFVQKFLYNFIDELRDLEGCTTLLIGEADQSGNNISRDTLSEFACDGIVLITFDSLGGEYSRSLTVRKMRHTKNDEDVHPMEISNEGIKIHSIE